MENRAGKFVLNLHGKLEYTSFLPNPLPPKTKLVVDEEMVELIAEANRYLGILNGISKMVPNIELFVSMYVRKEALLSSQIEGTQATLDDILDPNLEENTNRDVKDVINYLKASSYGKERLDELPISGRLLKEIHKILMDNVRGEERNPGKFRHTQNWIGPAGSTLNSARYVPPNPDHMKKSISDLEKFINQNDKMDFIIKAGLIHYQFETIHPFLDGNGRIGRLLINLFFIEKKVLTYETLYISYFLKRNRIEYYDRLMEVRSKGNFEQWVKFFLLAVKESAIDSIETIEALTKLHNENLEKINNLGRKSSTVKDVFLYLEKQPIIEIKKTSEELSIAYNTVASAVESLEDLGILEQTKNVKRNRVFAYEKYLDILRKNT